MEFCTLACLGGFGHGYAVFDDLAPVAASVTVAGIFPAFPEETFEEGFLAHPLLAGHAPRAFGHLPDAPNERSVAVIGTRLDRQAEAGIQAARQGWHLIMEKPLAGDLAELEELHRAVRDSGRRLMTMLTMRGMPVFRHVREVVHSGTLGRLALVNLRKSYKWGRRPSWFGDAKMYPGTIPWVGIHALDLMCFISGQRVAEVAAFGGNFFHPERPACEDAAAMMLRGSGGLIATASADLLRPAEADSHGDDWIRVVGEKGTFEAGPARGQRFSETPQPIFREFIENLGGGREEDEDIGFHLTEACLAANRSRAGGGSERLDPWRWRFR